MTNVVRPPGFLPEMNDNNIYSNCVIVSLANSRRLQSWRNNNTDWVTKKEVIVNTFASFAGIENTPTALSACPGLGMLEVVEKAKVNGIDFGNQTVEVPSVGELAVTDRISMSRAVYFGGWWGGIELTEADTEAFETFLPTGANLSGFPSGITVERHAIILSDINGLCDNDLVTIATWDRFISVTWEWLTSRLDMAYFLEWA
ncbi:unnamed protein product [Sphagnum jensenii]